MINCIQHRMNCIILMLTVSMYMGCSDSSSTQPRNRCITPTIAECLDNEVAEECGEQAEHFQTICQALLQAEESSPKKSPAVVPELSGAHERIREIKEVIHEEQPPLYMPEGEIPFNFSHRVSQYVVVNINDRLGHNTFDHSEVFNALDDSFELSSKIQSMMPRAANKDIQIIPGFQNPGAQFMFDGLTYTPVDIYNKLDSIYVGKVTAWDDNDLQIESCEEYVFERYYGYTLFKDFASLHFDDPLRVAEYAYRDAYLDDEGIHFTDSENIKPGAVGSLNLKFQAGAKEIVSKKGTAVCPDPYMVIHDPYGEKEFMDSSGYSLTFDYPVRLYLPEIDWVKNTRMTGSTSFMDTTVLRYSTESIDCSEQVNDPDCGPSADDLLPKNFFLETLGKIKPSNTTTANGIILRQADLTAVYNQPDFDDAAKAMDNHGYVNNWTYHFVMLEAAKRRIPNAALRKKKLLEYKLLRKHLIDLLAERAYWEKKLQATSTIFLPTATYNILKNSETLSLSEKAYALNKISEFISGHTDASATAVVPDKAKYVFTATPVVRCTALDEQIEAVLLEAKAKGCLETDTDPSLHNYPTVNNDPIYHYGMPWSIPEMRDWLEDHAYDLSYDKVFCDWSPEHFTDAAQKLVPDEFLDKAYRRCQRITAGDFAGMNPQAYTFTFPTDCQEKNSFRVWSPNEAVDYTVDTSQFTKFEKLIEVYPHALEDCFSFLEHKTTMELESRGMNYYDPVSEQVLMSKSSSYFDYHGGAFAGITFGYAMGWLYEGYENITDITEDNANGTLDRSFVCDNTNYFSFGNYFVQGSFLTHDFVLCAAGSYASNKTTGLGRPTPPALYHEQNRAEIINDMSDVATDQNVAMTSFMFIKNEKMTYTYDDEDGLDGTKVEVSHSTLYNPATHQINYQNGAVSDTAMLSIKMKKSVPVCGIISVTVSGAITGDIDADTYLTGNNAEAFDDGRCKSMDFNYTPRIDFDGFASASVTVGLSGVASVSAGVDIGLKFISLRFPYETKLFLSERNQAGDPDREFNYDVHTNVYSSLDYQLSVLAGYFGVFVEIDYTVGSSTYRQTLFSWDGYNASGNLDRVGTFDDEVKFPVKIPVRALYGLANKRLNGQL